MKIGIFGSSSACSPERYLKAKNQATKLGYELIEANDPTASYGSNKFLFACDSRSNRIEALKKLLRLDDINLIHAARGGYGALELLPDLAIIKSELALSPLNHQVFLAGFSDVTTILLALDGVSNLNLVHGSGFVDSFHDYQSDSDCALSTKKLVELVEGTWKGYTNLSLQNISNAKISGNEALCGSVLGGNLLVVASLVGSQFMPDFSGRILFLEETGEKPYKVHRALSQLKLAGAFDKLLGVLIGDFNKCTHEKGQGPNIDDVFKDIFSKFNYPVLKGFPGGHSSLNLPLIFNKPLLISLTSIMPA